MFVYVGVAATPQSASGINGYRLDPRTGRMEHIQHAPVPGPSYLAVSASRNMLYVASRDEGGGPRDTIVGLSIDPASGRLTSLDSRPIPAQPAYLSLDHTERFTLFASPMDGVVGVAALAADGRVGAAQVVRQPGPSLMEQGFGPSSIGKVRWPYGATPFPHCIRLTPDNRFALVADVGLNRVFVYRFDGETGRLSANAPPWAEGVLIGEPWRRNSNPVWDEPDGAGPRHMEFHPNGRWLYVVHEAGSVVTQFDYDAEGGRLALRQTIPTLPADFRGSSSPADIHVHPSGRFLYASNRRHDSIVAYAIDPADGRLRLIGFTPAGGENPRSFVITPDGGLLLLANLGSSAVLAFAIDARTGRLTPNGMRTEVPSPSCVALFAPRP